MKALLLIRTSVTGHLRTVATDSFQEIQLNSELESKILCREIGRLVGPVAGIGASWAARRLPSVAHEVRVIIATPSADLFSACASVLHSMRKESSELPSAIAPREASAIVGSGIKSMNPTLVRVVVADETVGSSLFVRAVAKEGAIPQNSAELAVHGFMTALGNKLPIRIVELPDRG